MLRNPTTWPIPAALAAVMLLAGGRGARAAEPKVEAFALENGLRVMLRPVEGATQVALVVLYGVGGDHDPEGKSGLAHLVEHLYVTAAAGETPSRTVDDYMKRYPAGWNAQTGDRYTVFAQVFDAAALEAEVKDAARRMGALTITQPDLDRERPRLLAEVENMFDRMPALAAVNRARERVLANPAGGRRGGLPDHVLALTLDEVREHWKRLYKPANARLVLAGAIDAAAAKTLVASQFAGIAAGEPAPAPGRHPPTEHEKIEEFVAKAAPPGAEGRVAIAYAAPTPGSPHYPAFLLLVGRLLPPIGAPSVEGPAVHFTPIDDPWFVGVSMPVKKGDDAKVAYAWLFASIDAAMDEPLAPADVTQARNAFGLLLGTIPIQDVMWAKNLYGLAYGLACRDLLGLDTAALRKAMESVTQATLEAAASAVFEADRSAAAVVTVP